MRRAPDGPGDPNAIAVALGVLGDEWTLLLVRFALAGARRYGQWKEHLSISDAVLSARLAALVDAGVFARVPYCERPPRFEYRLTEAGRDLWQLLVCIWSWEQHHVAGQSERLPRMRHRSCGHPFDPELACRACGANTDADDVQVALGPSGAFARSVPIGANRRRGRGAGAAMAEGPGLFPETMALLGNRWSAAMLGAAFLGISRFTDFQQTLGAPPTVLAERLSEFTALGVLEAGAGDAPAERAAYRLSPKGKAFFPAVASIVAWGERWSPAADGPALLASHAGCGRPFVPELRCSRCGDVLTRHDVIVEPADRITAKER